MTEQMNLRLDKSLIKEFEDLAKEENLDRAALVKKVLVEGIKNERLNVAIQKYVLKQISIEKASQIAGVSLYNFIETLSKYQISTGITVNDYKSLL